ncbi:hypothetical protein J3B02_005493, partial [Coemansia erecta]
HEHEREHEHERDGATALADAALLIGADSPADRDARDRELAFYHARIEGFIGTHAYHNAVADRQSQHAASFVRGIDIAHMVYSLRTAANLDVNEVEAIFKRLDEHVVTDEQVTELLAALPQSQGGLQPLAYGFYHPSSAIRLHTVRLFERIERNLAGARYVRSTNFFHQCAFSNLRHAFAA